MYVLYNAPETMDLWIFCWSYLSKMLLAGFRRVVKNTFANLKVSQFICLILILM